MSIVNRRNAVIGWVDLARSEVGRKAKARSAGPAVKDKRPNKPAKVAAPGRLRRRTFVRPSAGAPARRSSQVSETKAQRLGVRIRHAEPSDHARVAAVIDDWWGGRRMRDMLPRLFFTHFRDTSFVAEDGRRARRRSCAASSLRPPRAGVLPLRRRLARQPEDRPGKRALRAPLRGRPRRGTHLGALRHQSPKNTASIAFHTRIGFEIEAEVRGLRRLRRESCALSEDS